MEAIPVHVETAIYLYFVLVALGGMALYARFWFDHRRDGDSADGASSPN
ncbi:hypothetical protein [Natrarchaeobius chitinivorans]|nr:hypothetical protein [Natrarchaeobius chitinivorans]